MCIVILFLYNQHIYVFVSVGLHKFHCRLVCSVGKEQRVCNSRNCISGIDVNRDEQSDLRPQAMATAAVQDIENHLTKLVSSRGALEASGDDGYIYI